MNLLCEFAQGASFQLASTQCSCLVAGIKTHYGTIYYSRQPNLLHEHTTTYKHIHHWHGMAWHGTHNAHTTSLMTASMPYISPHIDTRGRMNLVGLTLSVCLSPPPHSHMIFRSHLRLPPQHLRDLIGSPGPRPQLHCTLRPEHVPRLLQPREAIVIELRGLLARLQH